MMKAGNMGFSQALKVAKNQRPVVNPFNGLDVLLMKLEYAILNNRPFMETQLKITLDFAEGSLTYDFCEQDREPITIYNQKLFGLVPANTKLAIHFQQDKGTKKRQAKIVRV